VYGGQRALAPSGRRHRLAESFAAARSLLLERFADTHSLSLQQTLYAMASALIEDRPEIVEVRMSMPNRHHFVVDLEPFGLENENEIFRVEDRPYGLIEASSCSPTRRRRGRRGSRIRCCEGRAQAARRGVRSMSLSSKTTSICSRTTRRGPGSTVPATWAVRSSSEATLTTSSPVPGAQ
jgi:hypothetical protein